MALVDSADSVLMLYSFREFPERSFFFFENRENTASGVVGEEYWPEWEDPEKAIMGEHNKQYNAE